MLLHYPRQAEETRVHCPAWICGSVVCVRRQKPEYLEPQSTYKSDAGIGSTHAGIGGAQPIHQDWSQDTLDVPLRVYP